MQVEAGKIYLDESGRNKRLVIAIDDGSLLFMYPNSLERVTVPLAEFEAWAYSEYHRPE